MTTIFRTPNSPPRQNPNVPPDSVTPQSLQPLPQPDFDYSNMNPFPQPGPGQPRPQNTRGPHSRNSGDFRNHGPPGGMQTNGSGMPVPAAPRGPNGNGQFPGPATARSPTAASTYVFNGSAIPQRTAATDKIQSHYLARAMQVLPPGSLPGRQSVSLPAFRGRHSL
jgi:hypothetical protein